ncbi:YgdI/YgdR family lipoprotein [Pectobacterium quasiaquaticum]|uniref:YgdI/YgdR family lipoprotein n=1 Tax=Pectobacterium quasiaquaticum TaxID=2774015 RepID=A0A9Q2EU75_9GAMM|nr:MULTISPECIES: YgdI/YgdR family lipoprotein [Pectobacterium]MBE5203746.1 YgdI/YgdR family lipoprotein [Pectobacterium quasiaquaticum]MBE5210317.1 YgdI/YgdR family lipoprotein [Pectobacterium quasiaquaticum]MBE5212645.1 YgdI/YgdR family lipoprotein [Pectobacterium quasiaquaticum]MBE5221411.1 YgdI/YgdR family lipoprotein [Pectobacterium quasiaquaticum]MBE5226203.1 YgdI/YgdR family lipoprotein [Pectobacterium quasiaquaticum]
MKVRIKMAITLALLFTLAGCSSDYVMATKEGQMLLTQGKPVLDKDTGLLSYTDEQGNQKQINSDQISQIVQR